MSIYAAKGTVLQLSVASVFTTVSQLDTITFGEMKQASFPAPTLDQATSAIPKKPTKLTDYGTVTFEGFLDPALTIHTNLKSLLVTPAVQGWRVTWSDAAPTTWTFSGGGFGMGATAAQGAGLRLSGSIDVDGAVA